MGFIKKLGHLFQHRDSSGHVKDDFFESIFNSTLYGYIIYSTETLEVIETNRTVGSLFELPEGKQLKGLYISQVMMRYLAGDSPNMETLMNDIRTDWAGEAVFVSHTKKRFYAQVDTNILMPGLNDQYRILSILDITSYKKSEDAANTANKKMQIAAQSKSRFLSSMSHELRTPLNGIIGTSNLILSGTDISEDIRKHVSVIRYSSEHMLGIVNDILDFSKIDADKMKLNHKEFHLPSCLNNIVSTFLVRFEEQEIQLKTDFSIAPEHEFILGDETKLSQIIKNLLSNALKFTISGEVLLIVKAEGFAGTGTMVYFEVKDTGIGIPADKQQEIFEAFSQVYNDDLKRKYDGSGLGLTISSQLVSMMGGELKVQSIFGSGSSFYFTISFETPTALPGGDPIPVVDEIDEKKDIRGIRALVVEDNEINAGILRNFLKRWQISVKEAITGLHALELLKFHKFDIILMDLEMPEMNGYTTLKKIREQNITTPVIAFTATLLDDMNSLVTEAGFTDYLTKPFRPAALKKILVKYCERKVDYV